MKLFGSELKFHPKMDEVKSDRIRMMVELHHRLFGYFGFYGGGEYLRSLYFRRVLNRHQFKFLSVLDAGCGYGHYSFYLAHKYPKAVIDACDFDTDLISHNKYIKGRLNIKNLNFFQQDLIHLSEHDKYDMIFSIDVLESIEDDSKVVKNIYHALKEGGHFLLHTPNRNEKDTRGAWRSKHPYRVREGYTANEIFQLLEDHGFEIVEKINTFGFFGMIGNKIDSILPTSFLKRISAIPINCINCLDILAIHNKGNAFFMTAKKR